MIGRPAEPIWLDGLALERIAAACVRELGVAVRLPWTLRRVGARTVERRRRDPAARRRNGTGPGQNVAVPVRAGEMVSSLLAAPRTAWYAGERAPIVLALALHDAIVSSEAIRGDRGFLAAVAVLFFLDVNGWLAPAGRHGRRDFVLQVRRLTGEDRTAAARGLSMLIRADQRAPPGPS